MKSMTVEETKKVELDILSDVANFCDEAGLRYYLAYGTLIGAIRHKGFIPWDDDIDIWMPRDDYNKLIETYNQRNGGIYKLISPQDKISRHTFVKVIDTRTVKIEQSVDYKNGFLGVDIDIFPLDGEPSDDDIFLKWFGQLKKYYRIFPYLILADENNLKRKIALPIIRILSGGKKRVLKKTKELHSKYTYENSEFVGTIESCYDLIGDRFKKEWFEDFVLVDFEGRKFKVPSGYHEILTKFYGDYMELPPEEKRVTHHSNNTFWSDDRK